MVEKERGKKRTTENSWRAHTLHLNLFQGYMTSIRDSETRRHYENCKVLFTHSFSEKRNLWEVKRSFVNVFKLNYYLLCSEFAFQILFSINIKALLHFRTKTHLHFLDWSPSNAVWSLNQYPWCRKCLQSAPAEIPLRHDVQTNKVHVLHLRIASTHVFLVKAVQP